MTREEAKPFYIRVQGGRNYFSAAGRIKWFRDVHPDYTILTTPHTLDFDKMQAVFVATIMDPSGRVLSMGHKSCSAKQFPEWITKAETGSVSRALILLGFGEPDEEELDESDTREGVAARIVDAPVPSGTKSLTASEARALFDSVATDHGKNWSGPKDRGQYANVCLGRDMNSAAPFSVEDWQKAAEVLPAVIEKRRAHAEAQKATPAPSTMFTPDEVPASAHNPAGRI